jgi:hypothetical protein
MGRGRGARRVCVLENENKQKNANHQGHEQTNSLFVVHARWPRMVEVRGVWACNSKMKCMLVHTTVPATITARTIAGPTKRKRWRPMVGVRQQATMTH